MTATILDVRLLDRARKEIGEEIQKRQLAVAQGLASDFADYRWRCGEARGLSMALDILTEIVKSMGDNR